MTKKLYVDSTDIKQWAERRDAQGTPTNKTERRGHIWPHEAVRGLIERISSRQLEKGILVGISNKGGVVTKNLGEGGDQERNLSDIFKKDSEALASRWPRTGALLRKVSEMYQSDARREDFRDE